MKKIYKYPLALEDKQTIQMPKGSSILCVQTQHGKPCLWAMVDHRVPSIDVKIEIYGTGETVSQPDWLRYIGTFQINGGYEVYHVFLNEGVHIPHFPCPEDYVITMQRERKLDEFRKHILSERPPEDLTSF